MGALSYLVPVLIELDVGSRFLHLQNLVIIASVVDLKTMIYVPLDGATFLRIVMMSTSSNSVPKFSKRPRQRTKRSKVKQEWVKIRERNEALDSHIYARAAAAAVGYDVMP